MDPLASAAAVPARPKRRRRLWMALGAALLVAGALAVWMFFALFGYIQRAAAGPWTALHEAAEAIQTPEGAERYYQAHPGLARRFPTSADFVTASRPWAPRLAAWPPAMPGIKDLFRDHGRVNISTSGNHRTLIVDGYRGVHVEANLVDDTLVDLDVE